MFLSTVCQYIECAFSLRICSTGGEKNKKKKLSAITKLTVTAFKDTKWRKNFINFQIDRVKVGERPQGLIKRRDLDV